MERLNMSRSEIMKIPTFERRYYLGLLKMSLDAQNLQNKE